MIHWYLSLGRTERAAFLLLVGAFIFVMSRTFLGLLRGNYSFYRGYHSTPLFQFVMWFGAAPLIIPMVYLWWRRTSALNRAPFIGNVRSRIYHTRECEYQHRITSFWSRYPLFSKEQALEYGFRPCNWCADTMQ